MVKVADERSRAMHEILTGMKVVKLFGWEAAMASRIAKIRGREVALLQQSACARVANSVVAAATPVLVTLAVFATYTLWYNLALSPSQVSRACFVYFCVDVGTK
jgi:ATP-binding cassette, subfamily C (CFTR/MRP), member 1